MFNCCGQVGRKPRREFDAVYGEFGTELIGRSHTDPIQDLIYSTQLPDNERPRVRYLEFITNGDVAGLRDYVSNMAIHPSKHVAIPMECMDTAITLKNPDMIEALLELNTSISRGYLNQILHHIGFENDEQRRRVVRRLQDLLHAAPEAPAVQHAL